MSNKPDQDQPGSAVDQVDTEVTRTRFGQAVAEVFGDKYEHQSGGGGAGGHYAFASLAELDSVIAELQAEREEIRADGQMIRRAIGLVEPPANDMLSTIQADATTSSWKLAFDHNKRMLDAADAELVKLRNARAKYAHTEGEIKTNMAKQG